MAQRTAWAIAAGTNQTGEILKGLILLTHTPPANRDEHRTKAQKTIDDRGGVENLDNKRSEVAPKNLGDRGIGPPKPSEPKKTE